MVAASLLLYLRDHSRLSVAVIAFGMLLIVLGLLAFGVIVGAGTVDNSQVDGRYLAPFRWPSGALTSG